MTSYRFAILKSDSPDDHLDWVAACEHSKHDIEHQVIELCREDWLEPCVARSFDCLLTRPPASTSILKQLYDERTYVLSAVLGQRIYPKYEETLLYENKRMMAAWLQANGVPHPRTWIFYDMEEAAKFVHEAPLPIVAKTASGATGFGIEIIRHRDRLRQYVNDAFRGDGIQRKYGPNWRKANLGERALQRLRRPGAYLRELRERRRATMLDAQRGFVILQEYVTLDFEWRAVRIGESYFAHKKVRGFGEKISGTSQVSWDGPSNELLDFVKSVCDKRGFYSQALDIFEPEPGRFLVNELQCFFGSKNPHQMILDDVPGRYVHQDQRWTFEAGDFNRFNSHELRLDHVVRLLESGAL